MIIQIIGFSHENELFKKAMNVRYKVFVQEQNVDENIDFDGLDFEATHFIVLIDEQPAATIRYRETNEGIKLERMAVLPEHRNLGIGNLLLRYVLNELKHSKQKIYLHAQEKATKLYARNGFNIEGKSFYEANIKHYKMVREF